MRKSNPYWAALVDMTREADLDLNALKYTEYLRLEAEITGNFIEVPVKKRKVTRPLKHKKQIRKTVEINVNLKFYLVDGYLTTELPDRYND